MIYSVTITTPKNTAETSPLITTIPVVKGVIHKLECDFPPGNQFLHRLRIRREGAFIFPSNASEYFTADGKVISFREHWPIVDEPFSLNVLTWNLDETYDHTVIVRLGLLRKNIITPWLMTWRERMAASTSLENE